ncbi:hypothetical protein GCM10007216_17600 [Thalassobacillus devorans]|uniref:DUF2487 family protein n=1 Tax=Thalassobacillus devorans TaxID=279813 RepID=A0ABQ1NY48_9BACI|nr:YpiF family protein [Thalassobacillus devorans]NIK28296.1 hypothetical protein [Thalassobacillus devorans]GGC87373.1 hypothetical protein GCM10007216_17600 [Thalassobacillus devorans]
MKWNQHDISQYVEAKEYIDTLIVPLIPFGAKKDEQMKTQAFQKELLTMFVNEIEKEYKGRIVLLPEYYYLSGKVNEETARLNHWVEEFTELPFEHVFLFTFDVNWRKASKDVDGEVIWLPGLQSGNLQSSEAQSFIKEQVSQIAEMIRSYW